MTFARGLQKNIEKLPILLQGMNTKKPTWNNIRYFYRNVHYSQIIKNGICIQAVVKALGSLHEQIKYRGNALQKILAGF